MSTRHWIATYVMDDGRKLTCEYSTYDQMGTFECPPEHDASEPTYCIDGDEVLYSDLDSAMQEIADELYDNTMPKHGSVVEVDEPDYEPEDDSGL